MLRPDATRRLTCDSVVVELRGFEPLTPCMPLMLGWFTSPCTTSRTHATEQGKGAARDRVVRRREVTCSAVSGKSLAKIPRVVVYALSPVRQAGAAGALSRRWRRRNRQRPKRPSTVIPCRGDLDPRAAVGRQRHDHRVAPDPLDLTRLGRPRLSCKAVDGHQLVAEQHRLLGPDEHLADPAAIAALPLGSQPRAPRRPRPGSLL